VRLPAPAAPSGADGGAGDVEAKAAREDRQYAVDATIVRVMKARKTLSHAALLGDVFAQLKRPASTADVKARVESLIEREYLERDPRDAGVYNYLA
jgi:cullin-4